MSGGRRGTAPAPGPGRAAAGGSGRALHGRVRGGDLAVVPRMSGRARPGHRRARLGARQRTGGAQRGGTGAVRGRGRLGGEGVRTASGHAVRPAADGGRAAARGTSADSGGRGVAAGGVAGGGIWGRGGRREPEADAGRGGRGRGRGRAPQGRRGAEPDPRERRERGPPPSPGKEGGRRPPPRADEGRSACGNPPPTPCTRAAGDVSWPEEPRPWMRENARRTHGDEQGRARTRKDT